ncbi:MAG: helix-hairpin-helix domain-containing protein [Gammaproteobacteria bacterium]|nr:helix-hairpin-helix domain-containing protein [Gammaproteobacteria bacterium]
MVTNTARLFVIFVSLACLGAAAHAQSVNHQKAAGILQLFMFAASAPAANDRQVDVNTADAETLERKLAGMSPEDAAAIVAHRDRHGEFRNMRDLLLVENLDTGVVWRNRYLLTY